MENGVREGEEKKKKKRREAMAGMWSSVMPSPCSQFTQMSLQTC
jgi:hypothetical protein